MLFKFSFYLKGYSYLILFYFVLLFIFQTKFSLYVPKILLLNGYIINIDFDPKYESSKTTAGTLINSLINLIPKFQGECKFKKWELNYTEIQENNDRNKYYYIFDNRQFCQKVLKISTRHPEKFKNTIFGPIGVPSNWVKFPQKNYCLERNWKRTLSMMGHYVVHSNRVRKHLLSKSETFSEHHKYSIMRACTNIQFSSLKPFKKRLYDILYYEKYADLDRKSDGLRLFEMFVKANYTVKRLSYFGRVDGASGYNFSSLIDYANNSKFVVYFSFWDTGAIALKEIQNFGIFSFSVQKDLVHEKTGLFVPELDSDIEKAFKLIDEKIKSINDLNVDEIAKINQYENSCMRSLEDLCHIVSNG